jgi:hypothetical protein
LLSKWKFVVARIVTESGLTNNTIRDLQIKQRDDLFEKAYLIIFQSLYPNLSTEEIDRRKIGDISFISLYDLLKKAIKNNNNYF